MYKEVVYVHHTVSGVQFRVKIIFVTSLYMTDVSYVTPDVDFLNTSGIIFLFVVVVCVVQFSLFYLLLI